MQSQNKTTTREVGSTTGAVSWPDAETVRRRAELLLCRARAVARTIGERVSQLLDGEKGRAIPGPGESSGTNLPFRG
jgi:hypothetical protein